MNNKITFPKLATLLAERSGRSKRFSEDFLRDFFSLISETLEAGDSVKIKGLGTFRLARVEPRRSVDVTTGEPMEISGHTKVSFTPAKELAEAINAPFEAFTAIEISDDVDIDLLFSSEELEIANNDSVADDQESEIETTSDTSQPKIEGIADLRQPTPQEETIEIKDESLIGVIKEMAAEIPDQEEDISSNEAQEKTATEGYSEAEAVINNDDEEEISETVAVAEETAPIRAIEEETDIENRSEKPAAINEAEEETSMEKEPEDVASSDDTEEVADIDTTTEESDPVNEAEEEESVDEEAIDEVEEEIEAGYSRKKNWIKGILIVLGAAVIALFATLAIWYVFATNDFNKKFNRQKNSVADNSQSGFVVGKESQPAEVTSVEPAIAVDSMEDRAQTEETEEEVPTAPSDIVVYDTISTTRYLTTMAKSHYGNYNLWPYIYEENKAFLGHPDRIRPGTPVVIPKLSKYGVDPTNKDDIEKAKKLGIDIYSRYGKKI